LPIVAKLTDQILQIHKLGCVRGERTLFSDLSFTVGPGDVVQIEGPNGAGKTSLLRILCGLAVADAGEVSWNGQAIDAERQSYHRQLLFLGHHSGVRPELTAYENLECMLQFSELGERPALWQTLAQVGLAGLEEVPAEQLSAGQQRRVALARLWLSDKRLWILDEPFTAIDRHGVRVLQQLFFRHAAQGGMVILTTHQELDGQGGTLRRIRLGETAYGS